MNKSFRRVIAVGSLLLSGAVLAQATQPAQVIWENKPEPRSRMAFITSERYVKLSGADRSAYVAGVLDTIETLGPDQNARLIHECLQDGTSTDAVRVAVDEYVRTNAVKKIGNVMSVNVNNAMVDFCLKRGIVAH